MSLDDIAKTIRQLEIEVERLKARETKSVDVYLEIAKGNVPGHTFIHKFGAAPDFDTGDNAVTVWDGADDGNIDAMVYTYSASADIDTISSSNNGDTQDIEIQGLDNNFDLVIQTKTITGQTEATLATPLRRVFRMKNVNSSDNAGHIYLFTGGGSSSGVPSVAANVRAIIQPGNNQTLMAIYTVPNGKTAYMDVHWSGLEGAAKASPIDIHLIARPESQVFQLKWDGALHEGGTSHMITNYKVPEKFDAKTDIEITANIVDAGVTGQKVIAGFDIVLVDD